MAAYCSVLDSTRSGLAHRPRIVSLHFLVKHHGRFFNDGRGGPARLQRVGAVGLAAGADAAREIPAQVAGRQRRGWAEAQVRAVGPLRRGQVDAGAEVRCGTGRAQWQVAVAGVQAIGFEHGAGLRGAARHDAGQERREGAVVRS